MISATYQTTPDSHPRPDFTVDPHWNFIEIFRFLCKIRTSINLLCHVSTSHYFVLVTKLKSKMT